MSNQVGRRRYPRDPSCKFRIPGYQYTIFSVWYLIHRYAYPGTPYNKIRSRPNRVVRASERRASTLVSPKNCETQDGEFRRNANRKFSHHPCQRANNPSAPWGEGVSLVWAWRGF
eukprot:961536-Rhodomonas_salina.2